MQFTDIKNKVYLLTGSNSTSFPIADLTREANNALERVVSLIMGADGRWQFDDTNQTDLPIATTALVSGQSDYTLSTSHLKITDVHVKTSSGSWYPLKPIDPEDYPNEALNTTFSTSGSPEYYDIVANSVFLYPASNYSLAAALKVFYQRAPSYFETTDTTKTPGFNSLYHDIIPLWISYNYAMAKGLKNANQIFVEIERKEKALVEDYANRNADDSAKMTMAPIQYI